MQRDNSGLQRLYQNIENGPEVSPTYIEIHQDDLRDMLKGIGWTQEEVDAYYKEMEAPSGVPIWINFEKGDAGCTEDPVPAPALWLKDRRERKP